MCNMSENVQYKLGCDDVDHQVLVKGDTTKDTFH